MTHDEPLDHVIRPVPPWRVGPPLTECGRAINDLANVIGRDELRSKLGRLGKQRTAMTTCMTCWSTASHWPDWDTDPARCLGREVGHFGTYNAELNDELRAIALLVDAHRDEFTELLSGLGQTASIDELRKRRAQRGTR